MLAPFISVYIVDNITISVIDLIMSGNQHLTTSLELESGEDLYRN